MLGVATLAAHVDGHVLHDAQDRHANLLEHLDALLGVQQGYILRCSDNHRTGHWHPLGQRELNVPGAGWHVDDEVIQVFPVGLAQQLVQCLGGHRATPDHGFVFVDQKADRHDLHTVVLQRLHGFAVVALRTAFHAHHHRLAGAVNIGIQQANAGPFGRQGQRQVGGGGTFADAAFARRHGDDVFDLRQQGHATLRRMGADLGGDVDGHVIDATHALGSGHQRPAQCRNLAFGGVAQFHVKRHFALGHAEVFEHFCRNKVFASVGVNNGLQGLQ